MLIVRFGHSSFDRPHKQQHCWDRRHIGHTWPAVVRRLVAVVQCILQLRRRPRMLGRGKGDMKRSRGRRSAGEPCQ